MGGRIAPKRGLEVEGMVTTGRLVKFQPMSIVRREWRYMVHVLREAEQMIVAGADTVAV